MAAPRFYLPPERCQPPELVLSDSEAHHALHVLRLKPSESVTVLDGAGEVYACQILDCGRHEVRLAVLERRSVPAPPYRLTLLQALPKGKLIDSIIQKATELGVWRIVPLVSERVVIHLEGDQDARRKAAKWQAVAVEAIKQCGSAWLPRVEPPVTPQQYLALREPFELPLVGSLQPDSKHPRHYFELFRRKHGRNPVSLCVWVGPEGDFSPVELANIQAAGARPITLGPLVLRAETAAIYSLAVLSYELQAAEI
jgi:16S rRNA (uracil1498-N3)-methyltransferase